jgi:hypothetical protein
MAEETKKTVLEVKIEAAEAAKTIGDLRKSLKGLIDQQANVSQGSAEWKKLTKAINETEGKIGDLQDSFATLKGSGIERATASLNFLKEGFLKLDFGLVKTGLAGLKTALASTGILLLTQGVMYLIENFDDLTKGSGFLSKALKFLGDTVGKVITFFTDFLGFTSKTERAFKQQAEAIKKFSEQSNQALSNTTAEYDRQIAVMKANGESTVEIERAKQKAIVNTNIEIIKQLQAYQKAGGQLSEDQIKQINTSAQAIKNARTAITVSEIEENNKRKEEDKKALDTRTENYKKYIQEQKAANEKYTSEIEAYRISQIQDEVDRLDEEAQLRRRKRDEEINESKASADVKKQALINSENIYQNELNKIVKDFQDKQLKDQEDFLKKQHKLENDDLKAQAELNLINYADNSQSLMLAKINQLEIEKNIALENTELTESQRALIIANYEQQVTGLKAEESAKQKQIELDATAELDKKRKETQERNYKYTKDGLSAGQSLSDAVFAIQSSKLKKGSAEAEALAKKQFNVNKAFSLASATIDGYKSVVSTFAATPGGLAVKTIAAGIAGVFAAAQIAKIAGSKYEGKGEDVKVDTGGGAGGGMSTAEPPTITQPIGSTATTPGTNFDAQGNVIGGGAMKAYVVETEITNKQTTVNRLQSQAEFG